MSNIVQKNRLTLPNHPSIWTFLNNPLVSTWDAALASFKEHRASDQMNWSSFGTCDWAQAVGNTYIASYGLSRLDLAISHVHPGSSQYDPCVQNLVVELLGWTLVKERILISMRCSRAGEMSEAELEQMRCNIEAEADTRGVNAEIQALANQVCSMYSLYE